MIVGLTGSVASGKSTVAGWMRETGIAVHDADAVVHSLMSANGQAVAEIISTFGRDMGTSDGGIDRRKLGGHVFANPGDRKRLESILHPLVRQHRDLFLRDQQRLGSQIVVLDVPLLYETGGDGLCDHVIVVDAGEKTIQQRALSRPGMTAQKLRYFAAKRTQNVSVPICFKYRLTTHCSNVYCSIRSFLLVIKKAKMNA